MQGVAAVMTVSFAIQWLCDWDAICWACWMCLGDICADIQSLAMYNS
jgi:hypothetical protein